MSEEHTLKTTVEAYLKSLAEGGTKSTTVNVYKRSLDIALTYFKDERIISDILTIHVGKFFTSDALNKHENGKPKAEATVKQNKRVFRQCMDFAKNKNWIDAIPIPKAELQHARNKVSNEPEKAEIASNEN